MIYIDNNKFEKSYVNYIQDKVNSMDKLKNELNDKIEKEKQDIEENKRKLEEVKLKNSFLKDQYESLLHILKVRGSIIEIINRDYGISQWDNLFLHKNGSEISIKTKKEDTVYRFDKEQSNILSNIIKDKDDYSIVVIRVKRDKIIAQLRLK